MSKGETRPVPEDGRYMSAVKLGPKGQIVIPKEVRDMFGIGPGDSLLLLADIRRGIALQSFTFFDRLADAVFTGNGHDALPQEDAGDFKAFAQAVEKLRGKKDSKQ